jgi:hypothetical protein
MSIETFITWLPSDEAEMNRERDKQGDGIDKCCRKHKNNYVVKKGNLLHTKTRK